MNKNGETYREKLERKYRHAETYGQDTPAMIALAGLAIIEALETQTVPVKIDPQSLEAGVRLINNPDILIELEKDNNG